MTEQEGRKKRKVSEAFVGKRKLKLKFEIEIEIPQKITSTYILLNIFLEIEIRIEIIVTFFEILLLVNNDEEIFKMPPRATLENVAIGLLKELYEVENESDEELEVDEQVDKVQPIVKTYAQSLQEEIERETAPKTFNKDLQSKKSLLTALRTEMNLFENTNQKGEYLGFLNLILKNISPTSVACESSFSIAGNMIPKSRSHLSDGAIDDLCFEQAYFGKEHLYK